MSLTLTHPANDRVPSGAGSPQITALATGRDRCTPKRKTTRESLWEFSRLKVEGSRSRLLEGSLHTSVAKLNLSTPVHP